MSRGRDFGPWLVSPRFDLQVFLLPAVVALALVPVGSWFDGELPLPMWVVAVLAIDVAHVYATLFVTYLDVDRRREIRPWLVAVPLVAAAVGVLSAAISMAAFWTMLAYVAVFHFIRQQYGWVALYQRGEPELARWERWLDRAAVYASTLYPVLWWHAQLPRNFHWFVPGDFVRGVVPEGVVGLLFYVYAALLAAFAVVTLVRLGTGRRVAAGKVVVVATTAACWGVGIVATNTDWAFTITNVVIHGVPYTAFVWHQCGRRIGGRAVSLATFALALVAFAYLEELAWDRLVWREFASLFPLPALTLSQDALRWAVVILAIPQFTHYMLDARIWRRTSSRASGSTRSGSLGSVA